MVLSCATVSRAQVAPFAGAGANMPDARQMSGMPLPVGDVPVGTVTVRVVRGAMTNPLTGETVQLTVGGSTQTAKTDADGRATFSSLAPGTRVKASATVNGETLDSQEFDVPATGGIRLALVATDPELEKKAEQDRELANSAPVEGTVVIGDQSRLVIELGDDGLNVFNILQIVNTARRPVRTPAPLVFDTPSDGIGLGLLEGAPKDAVASGHKVTITGPFAPGSTTLQFAYTIPFGSETYTLRQTMPAQMTAFALLLQTTGAMQVSSPQINLQRPTTAEGQSYIVAQGPAIPAGGAITLSITGLPHAPTWPRNVALTLASIVLIGGAWAAMRGGRDEHARRQRLLERRERLFNSLAALELQHRRHEVDEEHYAAKRRDLVASLEEIYVEIDGEVAA
jgi:hypothetical protein